MSQNGSPIMPMELHLNSCAVEVLDFEQGGEPMKQLRITHASGLLPLTLVMVMPEEAAQNVAKQLSGAQVVPIFKQLPE